MNEIFSIEPANHLERFFDCFCGGGGSGSGILRAYDKAGIGARGTFVNHWDRAIEIHEANHPEHRHLREDLFMLRPEDVMPTDRPYGFGWASPSCQQFSVSRGNRPINEQGRSHADTVVDWVRHCRPEVQMVENVKEFLDWGPLRQRRCKKTNELQWAREFRKGKKVSTKPVHDLPAEHRRETDEPEPDWELRMITLGYDRHLEPIPERKGEYFKAWRESIEALGYISEWKLIRSADHGDPTIRQRLFVQFVREDTGKQICWPDARYIKPGAKRPVFKTDNQRELLPWKTARNSVIDWSVKGKSIFDPGRKALAKATMRRIAIGTVTFGLSEFLLTSNKGFGDGTRSADIPAATLTCNSRGEGLVEAKPFVLPKDQGHQGDYVIGVDQPCPTVQTTSVDHLVQPFISHLRNGNGNTSIDAPLRTLTAAGEHQVLVDAFLMVMDNAGKGGVQQRAYSADEPVKTIPTKANQTLAEPSLTPLDSGIRVELITLENAIREATPEGADASRVIALLAPLMEALRKHGRADIRPWVYVYYSNGSVGSDIDSPVPTVRCKENVALCYPVLEFDGQYLLLDILYRMLTVKELQRAQGFDQDFVWPAGVTKTDIVKAIGNSVSCGVAEALTLAWLTQNEDIRKFYG